MKGGLDPADIQRKAQPVLNSPVAFYGGQNIWKVFSQGASRVNTNFQWGPLMSSTFTELADAFTAASTGTGTLRSALDATQFNAMLALQQQGFSVKAG